MLGQQYPRDLRKCLKSAKKQNMLVTSVAYFSTSGQVVRLKVILKTNCSKLDLLLLNMTLKILLEIASKSNIQHEM